MTNTFVHRRAWTAWGLSLSDSIVDFGEVSPGLRILFSKEIDPYLREVDRGRAILQLLDKGAANFLKLPERDHDIQRLMESYSTDRTRKHAGEPFLLVEVTGECPEFDAEKLRDIDEVLLGYDVADFTVVRRTVEESIATALTIVGIEFHGVTHLRSIARGTTYRRQDGRRVLPLTFEMGRPRVDICENVAVVDLAQTKARARRLGCAPEVSRVRDLLVRSMVDEEDQLRSFLTACDGSRSLHQQDIPSL